jgi:hypothetical protein
MSRKLITVLAALVTFGGSASLLTAEGAGQSVQCGAITDLNGCPSEEFTCRDVCRSPWVIDSMVCQGNSMLCYGHTP